MENCSTIDPWAWITDALTRDDFAVTKALQISLSSSSSASASAPIPSPSPDTATSPFILNPADPAPNPVQHRARNPIPCSTKIAKRKSRASKRSPTTYITADPANFREMVQQVTGVQFAGLPPVEPVLKPEPHRANRAGLMSSCLPTLDTSAFLLDRAAGAVGPVGGDVLGFDFEGLGSFPTLESWSVM